MKVLRYEISGNDIILYEQDLVLSQTLDCGQAFRWSETPDGGYIGGCLDHTLKISGKDGVFRLENTTEEEFLNIWKRYLDLDTDYSEIKRVFCSDKTLKSACEYSQGMRLLRQDPWEALISYIFSSNNTIRNIKAIVARLYEHYGHFPSPEELLGVSEQDLAYLRCGFRAKYIADAVEKVNSGEVSIERIMNSTYEQGKAELMTIKGVGPKVADCVLLYGFRKTEAMPVDVWIKRALETYYPDGLPECTIGNQGIAQLYLFNYIRNLGKED